MVLAEGASSRRLPTTKITMVRIQPRLGTPTGSPIQPPGIPKTEAKPTETVKPEEVSAPKPKATPQTPVAKPQPTPKVAKPPRPEPPKTIPTKAVPIGKKSTPTTTKPQVTTRKVETPDSSKIQSALSGIDSELHEREKQEQAASQTAGSPGEASSGTPGLGNPQGVQARDPGFALYQSQVRSKIVRNWVRTHSGTETQRLSARVFLKINASGAVVSKSLVKRSGDSAFDHSALRAVEQASPLPAPPDGVKSEALREGFVVDFRSRVLGNR